MVNFQSPPSFVQPTLICSLDAAFYLHKRKYRLLHHGFMSYNTTFKILINLQFLRIVSLSNNIYRGNYQPIYICVSVCVFVFCIEY